MVSACVNSCVSHIALEVWRQCKLFSFSNGKMKIILILNTKCWGSSLVLFSEPLKLISADLEPGLDNWNFLLSRCKCGCKG